MKHYKQAILKTFFIVLGSFILIEIFAAQYYFIYFIAFTIYLYFFNSEFNTLMVFLWTLLFYLFFYFFDECIFEFFLSFEVYNYYIYIENKTMYLLSLWHLILLKSSSYYFDLKKLRYNLVKK